MPVVYKPHHGGNSPEERIRNRYRNSGTSDRTAYNNPTYTVKIGEGPNRLFSNHHERHGITGPASPASNKGRY